MRIEKEDGFETIRIFDAPNLDAIRVILRDYGGRGLVVIECYSSAWATWFGAIGDGRLKDFVCSCSVDYLVNRLADPTTHRRGKRELQYLGRIVRAAQDGLRADKEEARR